MVLDLWLAHDLLWKSLEIYLLATNKSLSFYETLQMLAQQVDSNGRVSGSYSWMMPDGGTMAFSSRDQNMDPVPSQKRYNNNYLNNKQNFSDRNNLHVPTGQQMRQTNKSSQSHSLRTSDPVTAGYDMRVLGKDAQWIENSDEVRAGNDNMRL